MLTGLPMPMVDCRLNARMPMAIFGEQLECDATRKLKRLPFAQNKSLLVLGRFVKTAA